MVKAIVDVSADAKTLFYVGPVDPHLHFQKLVDQLDTKSLHTLPVEEVFPLIPVLSHSDLQWLVPAINKL